MLPSINLFIFLLVSKVLAEPLPEFVSEFDIVVEACNTGVGNAATFCREGRHPPPLVCACSNPGKFITFMDCLVRGEGNRTEIITQFAEECTKLGNETTYESAFQMYNSNFDQIRNASEIEGFNATRPITYPVLMDFDQYKIDRKYVRMDEMNGNYAQYFGYGLIAYWVVVLAIASIVNWTIHLFPNFTGKFTGPLSNFWRRHVSLPAAISRRKTHAFRFGWLIPSRMELLIMFGFTFLCAIFCGYGIYQYPGNSVYPSVKGGVSRMVAIRTGVLVGFICPFLVLFAGRNNFLQWLTRWNFATFISYHRFVSRLVILIVIIHAITFTVTDKVRGVYERHMSRDFVQWGVAAGVAGGIILVQSLLFLRRKSYEVFLLIHIGMAIAFIAGGYRHTVRFGYSPFYWSAIAIWAFDRLIRFTRLIAFGAPTADVTLLAEETLRVVIPKPSYWHAIPGGHAFVHFLLPSCFWQSHPFTFTDSSELGNYIVMYIKLKGGVTHGVYKKLLKAPGHTAKIKVLVEGPYGEASSARKYKNAVFIAGGNGIPGIYSECIDLSRRTADGNGPRLKLIWVLREWKSLAWFYHELKNLTSTNIDTTIYITKPSLEPSGLNHLRPILNDSDSSHSVNVEKQISEDKDRSDKDNSDIDSMDEHSLVETVKNGLPGINFKEGRPNMHDLVCNEIQETDGSLAFVACGHPVMVDDIRFEVSRNLDMTKHRVEYFEQLQVWA